MKLSHIVAAAAVAFCASQAGAQSISVAAAGVGDYVALAGLTGSFSVGTSAIPNVQAVPLGASSFDVITLGQTATLTFGAGVTSYTFLWGSPDLENKLVVDGGAATFTGANVVASGYGLDSSSRLVTITDLTGLSSLSFTTTKIAFEVARVNPVPEPETYALMLAGLGAIGFVARRRKAA